MLALEQIRGVPTVYRPPRLDRSWVMRDAHRQYRQMKPLGWSWSRCLKFSWARAKAGAMQ